MADGIRDSTLVDFQAFTGIDDIETCVAILEQHDWSLETAVNSILQDGASATINPVPPSNATAGETTEMADCIMDPDDHNKGFVSDDPALVVEGASAAGPSTSFAGRSMTRMLHFQVEYRDKIIPVILPDTETIGKIKETLSVELGIPVDQQELKGLVKRKVEDRTVLRDLHLPKQNKLYLLTPQINNPTLTKPNAPVREDPCEMFDREYTLNIKFIDGSKYQYYPLKFQGSKSVREIKQAVFVLTDVASRFQVWSGWPDGIKDEDLLGRTGVSYPKHEFEMHKASSSSQNKSKMTTEEAVMEIDSSDEDTAMEPYTLEDDIFAPESELPQSRKHEPLMPESVNDETEALEHFTKEFKERYGDCHPVFYIGSLDDAIRDALQVKAKDRKLFAIYLHHEGSIFSNVFCSQLLCSEGIVNYLSSNCLTWAWDMTFEANRAKLITVATRHFGSVAASQIRNYKTDQLPALLLITRSRATNEVVDVIQGHVTLDELMTRLIHSVEVFTEQQQADMLEEREREAREQIKLEQDEAYQESLAADRAKAEAQKVEKERLMAEQEKEMQAQMVEEQKKQEELAVKEAIQASLLKSLPDEPPTSCKNPVSRIRFRLPTGEVTTRRFLATETVQTLLHYLTTKGFHTEEYKVLSTFPRRDITQLDLNMSLQEAKLFPQETLILEEKS
ncbi:FAS-associated factor 1-like [Haliotis rufescens]|uniref:FAS-associated factor 1-like n=1 Tax=Haliotis rufescens TaxID=6454 RepID=UPI001EB09303|nr:FAS-associated factor 1-like [Haliotis rufescens]